MRLPRLLRTTSFRIAALFALIFGVSAVAVGTFVFVNVKSALDREERARIQSDALWLKGEYDNGGMTDLMSAVRERQRNKIAGRLDYSIFRSNGERLIGNMPQLTLKSGWKHIDGPPDGDEPPGELEKLLVYRIPLSKDLWLVVGDDVGRLQSLGNDFLRVFALGLLLALILSVGGGVAVSTAFLRRIDSITRTAEAIIEGDIGRRIALGGSGDDLDRLGATLNRMLDRIGALMDSLHNVSTDIAHDLRTPLGHLRQVLEEARQRAASMDEYRDAVERGIHETDAILDTFAAMLRIAQIESGSRRAGFRRFDLSRLVSSLAQTFGPTAEDQGRNLSAEVTPGIVIEGDAELITQLLVNLMDNAIRHTPRNAGIVVRLGFANANAVLDVADNGAGVPAGEREKIFERFYRCEKSRTTAGNGLGLSLVAAVAGLHRATIAAYDNAPGLRVRVEFPGATLNAQQAETHSAQGELFVRGRSDAIA